MISGGKVVYHFPPLLFRQVGAICLSMAYTHDKDGVLAFTHLVPV